MIAEGFMSLAGCDGSVSPDPGPQARATAIAAVLAATGLALPGTLIQRHVRCGKPRCSCHADPAEEVPLARAAKRSGPTDQ
jgi:hypothetical protein